MSPTAMSPTERASRRKLALGAFTARVGSIDSSTIGLWVGVSAVILWAVLVPRIASWDVAVSAAVLAAGVVVLTVTTRGEPSAFRRVVMAALIIRVGVMILHQLGVMLPDSDADETGFLAAGEALAQGGWGSSLGALLAPTARDGNAYSGLIGVTWLVTGGGEVTARMVNILLGTGIVVLAGRIARELWGSTRMARAALITAVFPTAILYSVLVLREAAFTTLMLLAVLAALRWLRTRHARELVWVAAAGIGALQFHFGGVAILAGIGVALVFASGRLGSAGRRGSRIPAVAMVATLLIGAFALNFGSIGFSLKSGLAIESISTGLDNRTRGGASYLVGATPTSWQGLAVQAPLRTTYFLFSPLPWQLRTDAQLIGVLDGAAYLVAVGILLRKRRTLVASGASRLVVVFLVVFLVFFSFGVSNFGTAIRHRGKAVALFAALLAGLGGRREALGRTPVLAEHLAHPAERAPLSRS